MNELLNLYHPKTPKTLVYMLQQFDYDSGKLLGWALKATNINHSQKRGSLDYTRRARLMLVAAYIGWIAPIIAGLLLAFNINYIFIATCTLAPLASLSAIIITSPLMQKLIVNPTHSSEIAAARQKLANMKATKIAVLGSYGKTSMKELLLGILSGQKKVAATEGNKNVLISHARLVSRLEGNEDILIFEYGEGQPGDITMFANFSKPDIAVITGLTQAHMDRYPNLEAIASDFSTINDFVSEQSCFVNADSDEQLLKIKGIKYSQTGADGWKVSASSVSFEGTSFRLTKAKKNLKVRTKLLGFHHIGPITAAIVIAMKLGISEKHIIETLALAKPYEHRMQPRQFGGAWIIDDTYNGNIEGMKAGLSLLSALPASRRIYVTPGLVDQGHESEKVHQRLAEYIADSSVDIVVLMQNSVTKYIVEGLGANNFKGEIKYQLDPLIYYKNLEHFVADGDVVMLQNDWPDSYK